MVFVEEQHVSADEEYDEYDSTATHFLATDDTTGEACGTARWRFTEKGIKLERFAVLPAHRGKGIAQSLIQAVLEDIQTYPQSVGKLRYLHAQMSAMPLYQKFGFLPVGDIFEEANIKHMKMVL